MAYKHDRHFFLLILGLFFLPSCSTLNQFKEDYFGRKNSVFKKDKYNKDSEREYKDHLNHLGSIFLKSNQHLLLSPDEENTLYLKQILEKISLNNELLINNEYNKKPHFYIIKDKTPYHFSLPNRNIFISLGLIKKYVRNEGDLISILSYELLRSSRSLYYKKIVVPTGYINVEKILRTTRLTLEDKKIINKWMYYVLKRSGHDPYFYLSWIQQVNKNSSDFILMLGETKQISWEEFELKNFFIKKKNLNKISKIKNNSSREFYRFKNKLRDIKI